MKKIRSCSKIVTSVIQGKEELKKEKIWVPYEKLNLIPFNFAEVIINNDQLQQHPTPKSHNLNFESFIVQGYP